MPAKQTKGYKLLGPFKQLVSMKGTSIRGPLDTRSLHIISNAGILIDGDQIHSIGPYNEVLSTTEILQGEVIEFTGHFICLPGFIDCHTHICFAGSRAEEYALRNAGISYLEIAKRGGGIWDTVIKTRQASENDLIDGIRQRSVRHLSSGITTIEVKSGYGLSVAEELKILRAIKAARDTSMATLIPTCLAAHVHPKDFQGNPAQYLEEIATHLFPVIRKEQLTNRIDAFVEKEAFSPQVVAPYFKKAIEMEFDITVHADQFSTAGSELAIQFGAVSADHLEASTDKEIKALANSDTVATALPGASIGLGCPFAPARKILDAGGCLAIASDWNPGSAPMGDLLTQTSILGTYEKLTNEELLAGITFRAAQALRMKDRGRIAPGMLADLVLFETDHYHEIFYHQGQLKPFQVWKNGKLAIENNLIPIWNKSEV